MGTPVFFSVDVETSSTSTATGDLLSVGAVAFRPNGSGWIDLGEHYVVFDRNYIEWDDNTYDWWMGDAVPGAARLEIFSKSTPRLESDVAAEEFFRWSREMAPDGLYTAYFVADPVSFDYPWVDRWLTPFGLNPFHYRTIDIRSMYLGFDSSYGWDGRPPAAFEQEAAIPHHALHDARAQAVEFKRLWNARELSV